MRIFLLLTIILWIVNEILQHSGMATDILVLNFLVLHLSSFYGAIVFTYLVYFINLNKLFLVSPLIIEILLSIYLYDAICYYDLFFSAVGIISSMLVIRKSI